MKVLVGIATYKRPEKLLRLLGSLCEQTYSNFDVAIGFDNNDSGTALKISPFLAKSYFFKLSVFVSNQHSYVIGLWNEIHRKGMEKGIYDAHLALVDDVELYSDCLENVVNCLQTNYPDTDGVVGINQVYPGKNVQFMPAGQVLIGRKFVERYKDVNYQVCAPCFSQWYQDNELQQFATSLGKFKLCEEAKLIHHHPLYSDDKIDEAHKEVRGTILSRDRQIYNERQRLGLVWGQSWDRNQEDTLRRKGITLI
jgi:hypothetical protein